MMTKIAWLIHSLVLEIIVIKVNLLLLTVRAKVWILLISILHHKIGILNEWILLLLLRNKPILLLHHHWILAMNNIRRCIHLLLWHLRLLHNELLLLHLILLLLCWADLRSLNLKFFNSFDDLNTMQSH